MAENMFCPGLSRVTNEYKDGHTRIFKGYPEMNDAVIGMVGEWVEARDYESAILFFTEKCELDAEYSGFLIREFLRGNIKTESKKNEKEN